MNRWICKKCDVDMIKTSEHYRTCKGGCGKCIPLPFLCQLPTAYLADYRAGKWFYHTRLYYINKTKGLWKYVTNAHKRALTEKPRPGEVVAAVVLKTGKIEARVFRRAYVHQKVPKGK